MPKDPLQLVDLTTCRTDFEAEVLVHALESEGIPAKAFSAAASVLQWEIAVTQPIRVQVRRCDLERSRLALARVRQESVDFDWSELDAESLDEVCKQCGCSLDRAPDKSVCPECGCRDELGIGVGVAAPGRRARGPLWIAVVIVLLMALMLSIDPGFLRALLNIP